MDISELKQLLKHSPSVLVTENGEPTLVVMDYKAYLSREERRSDGKDAQVEPKEPSEPAAEKRQQSSLSAQELEMIDRLNKEIMSLKEQIETEEQGISEE